MRRLAIALLLAALPASASEITRAVATLYGVFSPRGYFNILVRLRGVEGVEWAKLDLKQSRLTLDFAPGFTITEPQMQQVEREAGYRAGPVKIEKLDTAAIDRTGPGWMKIKHPHGGNAFSRWLEENF